MKLLECEFEADVLAAAVQGRWPDRVDEQLRAHVSHCEICADVAVIAIAFDESRDNLRASAVLPDSGRVWWLARMRARREAIETAARPITFAQATAFGCAVALLGACFGATSTWFQSALSTLGSAMAGLDAKTLGPLLTDHAVLAVATLALLMVVPAVVYLALAKD